MPDVEKAYEVKELKTQTLGANHPFRIREEREGRPMGPLLLPLSGTSK